MTIGSLAIIRIAFREGKITDLRIGWLTVDEFICVNPGYGSVSGSQFVGDKMNSAFRGITTVALVLIAFLTPELARADLNSGTLRICRLPPAHRNVNLAPFVLPAGSSFVEKLENGGAGETVITIGNTSFAAKAQCAFAEAAIVKSPAEPHILNGSNKLFPQTQGAQGYLEADIFQGFR